jgi:hypothetical protein
VFDKLRGGLNILMAHTVAAFCRNDRVLNRSLFGYLRLHRWQGSDFGTVEREINSLPCH